MDLVVVDFRGYFGIVIVFKCDRIKEFLGYVYCYGVFNYNCCFRMGIFWDSCKCILEVWWINRFVGKE